MTLVTFSRGLCFSAVLQVFFFFLFGQCPPPWFWELFSFMCWIWLCELYKYIALFIVFSSFYSFELLDPLLEISGGICEVVSDGTMFYTFIHMHVWLCYPSFLLFLLIFPCPPILCIQNIPRMMYELMRQVQNVNRNRWLLHLQLNTSISLYKRKRKIRSKDFFWYVGWKRRIFCRR